MPTAQTLFASVFDQPIPSLVLKRPRNRTQATTLRRLLRLAFSFSMSLAQPNLFAVSVVNKALLAVTNSACAMSLAMTCVGVILSDRVTRASKSTEALAHLI